MRSRRCRELLCAVAVGLVVSASASAQSSRQAAANTAQATPATAPGTTSQGVPNALQGFSQNRDEPVHINSKSLEVRDKDKIATFLGDVHLTQGDTILTCQTLVVYYDQDAVPGAAPGAPVAQAVKPGGTMVQAGQPGAAGGQQQIRRMIAKGGVTVTQKDQTATGHEGVFEMQSNTVTLNGNVVITQGKNMVRGDKLTVDLTTGISHVESSQNHGRVEGLFLPSSQPDPHAPSGPGAAPKAPAPGRPN